MFSCARKILKPICRFSSIFITRNSRTTKGPPPSDKDATNFVKTIKAQPNETTKDEVKTSQTQGPVPFPAVSFLDEFRLSGGYMSAFGLDRRLLTSVQWYVDTKEPSAGGPVRRSGGGVGRLDASTEDGFFFKVNKSRLDKLKKTLKKQDASKGTTPKNRNKAN